MISIILQTVALILTVEAAIFLAASSLNLSGELTRLEVLMLAASSLA